MAGLLDMKDNISSFVFLGDQAVARARIHLLIVHRAVRVAYRAPEFVIRVLPRPLAMHSRPMNELEQTSLLVRVYLMHGEATARQALGTLEARTTAAVLVTQRQAKIARVHEFFILGVDLFLPKVERYTILAKEILDESHRCHARLRHPETPLHFGKHMIYRWRVRSRVSFRVSIESNQKR